MFLAEDTTVVAMVVVAVVMVASLNGEARVCITEAIAMPQSLRGGPA